MGGKLDPYRETARMTPLCAISDPSPIRRYGINRPVTDESALLTHAVPPAPLDRIIPFFPIPTDLLNRTVDCSLE